MAGSGILYPKAVDDLRGKITGIFSHDDCGADKVFLSLNPGQVTNPEEVNDPDKTGDRKCQELAISLSVPFLGRIPASKMAGDAGHHSAQVIYYVGASEGFESSKVPALPAGFVISRWIISDLKYAQYEVNLAKSIILGNHGLGSQIDEEHPIYLVAVSDNKSYPQQKLMEELEELREIAGNDKKAALSSIVKGK